MFKFSCDNGHPKVEWLYETTFSTCPTCRRQCAGKLPPLSGHASVKPAPMRRLIITCSPEAIDAPAVQELPPVQEPNRIVSVEFMDGLEEGNGPLEQFVNLTADEKWVDGTRIRNKDRLGARPRVKVRFERPGVEQFELELLRDPSTLSYTDKEEEREHYRQYPVHGESISGSTDPGGQVVLAEAVALAAAGGHVYRLQARDQYGNTVVSRSSLCVWRRLFIQPVVMKSALGNYTMWDKECASTLQAQFKAMYFDLVLLERCQIDDIDNIAPEKERKLFYKSIQEQCNTEEVSRLMPRLIILAFIRHFAEERIGSQTGVLIGEHKSEIAFTTQFMLKKHVVGHGTYAWVGLGDKSWLVTKPTLFLEGHKKGVALAQKCLKLVAPNPGFPKRLPRVLLDSASLPQEQRQELAKGGELKFKFRYPEFRGGIAIVGTSNLIAVATQITWQDTPPSNLSGFIIHELAHKLGMVPSGTENSLCDLEATKTSYEDKGHTGPHCHFGLENQENYLDVGGARCVMFGAPTTTTAFCDACTAALRKVHLGVGWTPCWEL